MSRNDTPIVTARTSRLSLSIMRSTSPTEVGEVLRMIESESLDVRAVTMGVSLRDTASEDLERTCGRIYEKLMRVAERLVPTTKAVHDDFAVPITSTRLSVTPLALVTEASRAPRVVPAALALDRAARELGVDYIGGFSALVEKGITPGDRALIDSIPEALAGRSASVRPSTWRARAPASTWTRCWRWAGS